MSGQTQTEAWAHRAATAESAVNSRFGRRLLIIPGTWLAQIAAPAQRNLEWHYWWQAHYLDCLLDAGWRKLQTGEQPNLHRAQALLRSIKLRNFFRLSNSFYDDMAWLALAAGRAEKLSLQATGRSFPGANRAVRTLGRQLIQGFSTELGGGLFWSKRRDFKNTPANGPAALYFARVGDVQRAQQLLDWLYSTLWDTERGLYLDGIHLRSTGPEREDTVWTYNQGPVLGALCAVPTDSNLDRAAEVVAGVERGLSSDGAILLHGDGDSGLFTGILVRYLAVAARNQALPTRTRATAASLVFTTAEAIWASRSAEDVFTKNLQLSADQSYPDQTPIQLSTQLQAWMIFESAHQLAQAETRLPPGPTTQ